MIIFFIFFLFFLLKERNIVPLISQTHRYVVECDASDVIVRAALPRVVEPESKGTGVSSVQSCVFPKGTVLHIDGPVIDLHAPDREITARKQIYTHTHTNPSAIHLMLLYFTQTMCLCLKYLYIINRIFIYSLQIKL